MVNSLSFLQFPYHMDGAALFEREREYIRTEW
jgi:hypothetical protein